MAEQVRYPILDKFWANPWHDSQWGFSSHLEKYVIIKLL